MSKSVAAKNARELSLHILLDVLQKDSFANLAIESYLDRSELPKLERALTTQLVNGVLRHLNTLEWILEQFTTTKSNKLKPVIKMILLVGIYQLIYLDKIPDSASCNEACKLAHKYGHRGVVGFVNGVLRNVARHRDNLPFPDENTDPVQHIVIKYSHPRWLVDRWLQRFGAKETIKLCRKNNEPAELWLRCNLLKLSLTELREKLEEAGVITRRSKFAPEGITVSHFDQVAKIPGFDQGHFLVQDESSIVVGHIVNPGAGTRAIDACSGPGGKTTHLAQLMNNTGEIKAFDIHNHKLKLIKNNCVRLGVDIVQLFQKDAAVFDHNLVDWAEFVLADVPCSGTGVLGRRSDARWRKSPEQLIQLPPLQLDILTAVSKYVKSGGVLVYSTCSIEPEENNEVIEKFLSQNSGFRLENLIPLLPFPVEKNDRNQAAKGYFQFLPHVHGTDGIFIARMKRFS